MNEPGSNSQTVSSVTRSSVGPEVAEADASCRTPLTALFIGTAFWIFVSSVLALVASIHFHSPGFLADSAWLGYGRLQPASHESLLYGCCLQASLGIGLWLFARLGRTTLSLPWLATAGAGFLNVGVAIGVGGILNGDRTGFPSVDMPGYAAPVLLIGYLLVGLSSAMTFHRRTEHTLFATQWFLLAALFWFPWIYTTGQLFLVQFPARGVAQAVIACWYANNFQNVYLWLTGLGAVFYFIPKLTGNDLHSRYLALLTFWIILLFASWGGISASAPAPAWMAALSMAATAVNLVTLAAVGLSAYRTAQPVPRHGPSVLPLRVVLFGVVAFLGAGLMQIVGALPYLSEFTDLTWFGAAREQLNVLGFFAMVAFGAIYFIVPRLAGFDCLCPKGARAHFWLSAVGIVLAVLPALVAGLVEGLRMRNPDLGFVAISQGTLHLLRVSTLGLCLIALGQGFFLINLVLHVIRSWRQCAVTTYSTVTADLFKPAGVKS